MLICFGTAVVLFSVSRRTSSSRVTTVSLDSPIRSQRQVGKLASWQLGDLWSKNRSSNSRSTDREYSVLETAQAASAWQSHLVVDLSDRLVYVYRDDRLQASYPVAVGQLGWETPTGSFQVLQMNQNPAWRQPITGEVIPSGANDNPLGDRWIGFWSDGRHQIGFHGTNEEHLIGQAVSHGCLRMRNQDIRMLYQQVAKGTLVLVRR
ncbi:L,D-transpeptidase [Coleofasciculus sp. FACHB-T130]|uniref:L,D-transpeptidase n=1 Tax=Coleofasciculus sp. FACHB-T130 TaxID=2692792 RepID=UPI0016886ED6|nr:L,D-transpeptidase [Coleofasciculus sp. FACHB-T130]MBD1881177.1 L,D-transpeptidase [Coleofasciculus sp. FACHB-T130]